MDRAVRQNTNTTGSSILIEVPAVWRCAECGEELDEHFDACWNCGTERNPLGDEADGQNELSPRQEPQPTDDKLVGRGRLLLLLLIAASLLFNAVWFSRSGLAYSVLAWILELAIWFAVYRAIPFAVDLMKFLAFLAAIAWPVIVWIDKDWSWLANAVLAAVVWLMLTRSSSIRQFLLSQRQDGAIPTKTADSV